MDRAGWARSLPDLPGLPDAIRVPARSFDDSTEDYMTELEFMKVVAARLSEALAQIAALLDMEGSPIEPEDVVDAVRRRVKGDA